MTEVEWHKLPEDPPKIVGDYLVTQHVEDFSPHVVVMHFNPKIGFYYYPNCEDELKAWAELPEPYRDTNESSDSERS